MLEQVCLLSYLLHKTTVDGLISVSAIRNGGSRGYVMPSVRGTFSASPPHPLSLDIAIMCIRVLALLWSESLWKRCLMVGASTVSDIYYAFTVYSEYFCAFLKITVLAAMTLDASQIGTTCE